YFKFKLFNGYGHQGTLSENAIEVNPCHSLPSNANQEDAQDASYYCMLVHYEIWKDQAEYLKNPHCSPSFGVECTPRYTSYGIMDRKYRCTNTVKLWTSCANPVPFYWKGELKKCAVAEKYWSEPKAFYVSRKTPLEKLEPIYNAHISHSDMLPNTWQEKGKYSAHFAVQGSRESMEDTFTIQETMEKIKAAYFAVFDGHGGNLVAEFARKNVWRYLVQEVQKSPKETIELNSQPMSLSPPPAQSQKKSKFIIDGIDYKDALKKAVEKTDAEILKRILIHNAGSTALIALIVGSKLIVANVGDSRGVMCDSKGNTKPISFDQKPGDKREMARIIAAGGQVILNDGTYRLNGDLAMSRALGDSRHKESGLSSEPDVRIYDLCWYKPQFLVLATDGLWDVMSNEEVVAFIKNRFLEEYYGAKSLAYFAHLRGSTDNISITVVNLKDKDWSCCSPLSRRQSQRCNEYFSRYPRSPSSGSESNRSSWSFKSSASSIRRRWSGLWPRNRNSKRAGSSPPSSP
ncbi:unnamed protein product, partial [Bemisia tabaci]